MNKPAELKNVTGVPLWIFGRHQPSVSGRFGPVTNPATGAVIRKVPFCNAADIDNAVKAAAAAAPGWGDTPPLRRENARVPFTSAMHHPEPQLHDIELRGL